MDAKLTGSFIAERRKQKGLTQRELAEKLQVTDKAVSRWETGKGLPETSLLKPLGNLLGVSVGELLAGKTIEEEHIKEQTDNILLESLDKKKGHSAGNPILSYFLVSILVACGCFYAAIAMDRPENYCVGIGMYLCVVIVTCTGIIVSKTGKK